MARTDNPLAGDDKRWIQTPDAWPNWPACPVKRKHEGFTQLGILWAGETNVYLVNMFDAEALRNLKAQDRLVYADLDALLADGWKVD